MAKFYFSYLPEGDPIWRKVQESDPLVIPDYSVIRELPFPVRKTFNSAGYDLQMPYTVTIPAGQEVTLHFGIFVGKQCNCVVCNEDKMVYLLPRSSLFKKKRLLTVMDPARNFGEPLSMRVKNMGVSDVILEKGEGVAQIVITTRGVPGVSTPFEFVEGDIENGLTVHQTWHPDEFVFQARADYIIPFGEIYTIMTGLKAKIPPNYFILLDPAKTMTTLHCLTMTNWYGVVDADYYGNPSNDGNIGFQFYNFGYAPVKIPKGEVIGVGHVLEYFRVEDDVVVSEARTGGFGSTDKASGCDTCQITQPE